MLLHRRRIRHKTSVGASSSLEACGNKNKKKTRPRSVSLYKILEAHWPARLAAIDGDLPLLRTKKGHLGVKVLVVPEIANASSEGITSVKGDVAFFVEALCTLNSIEHEVSEDTAPEEAIFLELASHSSNVSHMARGVYAHGKTATLPKKITS